MPDLANFNDVLHPQKTFRWIVKIQSDFRNFLTALNVYPEYSVNLIRPSLHHRYFKE